MEAPRTPAREDFFELDCLRGIAICLVFAIHSEGIVNWLYTVPPDASLWRSFVYGGHTAPTLFFVLSAFLLSRPFLAELRGGRRVDVRNYFFRRALRIMPLYATAITVAIVVTARTMADVVHALPYFAFANAIPGLVAGMHPFSGPWWTVATEVEFYLALPLLALAARSRGGRMLATSFVLVYVAVYVALGLGWLRFPDRPQFALAHSALGRGPAFLTGILAAMIYDRWGASVRALDARHGRRVRLVGDVLLVGAVLALGRLLQWNVTSGSYVAFETAWPVWRVVEGLLWATILLLLVAMPMHVKPVLANRAWARLGVMSYSIYLIHTPLLLYGRDVIRGWFPLVLHGWTAASATAVLLLATIAFALASITYRLIELPAMQRKARVPLWRASFGVPTPGGVLPTLSGPTMAEARLHHAPPRTDTLL